MSTISDIFKSYDSALIQSRDRYTELYAERIDNGRKFYTDFFHQLVIPFRPMFEDSASRSFIKRHIERFFGSNHIDFVAIDGTCDKDAFTDFIVFFGGAYGAKGRVSLEGDPVKVKYEKWEMKRDVSMVAWVPIPFAELADITDGEETFMVTDSDRVNLSSIHTSLMQLSEIYLAYNVARSSVTDCPNLIMLDQSLSGIMAATSHGVHTGLVGYPYDRRQLDSTDVTIAFAHPINDEFQIPSSKVFGRHNAIIAEFHKRGTRRMGVVELAQALGLTENELAESFKKRLQDRKQPICSYDKSTRTLSTLVDCRESWAYTVSLFENICKRLFLDKDQSALTYEVPDLDDPTCSRRRWMSPDDVQFLIAVGLRALVETCWKKRIMLVGVFKDSESRYLTRNYLGVCKNLAVYPELPNLKVGLLPWTDRIYLETIPSYCDDELEAPWASIEFDSTFMTLHLEETEVGIPTVAGVRARGTEIISPERLFLRSLGQFFLSRSKKTPLMGHVVFIERLAFPNWDKEACDRLEIRNDGLGSLSPMIYSDRNITNIGQAVMMYLLNTLTRNHFPEVIGYPDPLHKADWGAKSMGRRVVGMIKSSEIPFRSKPIAKTLRSIRDSCRR